MDYLLNDDESDNNLARKIFIFSNPGIFLLSCPPPCGHFLIQQSTAGGLSYKGTNCSISYGNLVIFDIQTVPILERV